MNRVVLALLALLPGACPASPAPSSAPPRAAVAARSPQAATRGRRHKKNRPRTRPRALLTLPADYDTDANLSRPFEVGPPRQVLPSFYEEHATLVQHSLIRFRADPINVNPPLAGGRIVTMVPAFFFAPPIDTDDLIEVGRQRDQMLEFRDAPVGSSNLGAGIGAFALSSVAAAHGPRRLRLLFNGPIHLGPAIFDSGGMGMGFSGSLPTPAAVRSEEQIEEEAPRDGGTPNITQLPNQPKVTRAHVD